MPDPTDEVKAEVTTPSSHEAEAIAASKTEEFTGMTIEQIQRELRKRRANDESQRTHVDLFKATSIAQPAPDGGGWSPGGADTPEDVDVMATSQAPRLTLPEDISQAEPQPARPRISHEYEPIKLFQGQGANPAPGYASPPQPLQPQAPPQQMPVQPSWQPNMAPPEQGQIGHPQSRQPGQYQSPQPYMNVSPSAHQAPRHNTWASGASTPPPVAPPMGWSPAPGPDGQPQQTLAEARAKLYGTSDDPFATLDGGRRASDSSVESYQKFRAALPWALAICGTLAVIFVVWALIPFPVPAPTSYTTYVSPDQQYLISKPDGWSLSRNGSKTSTIPDCETSMRYGAGRIDVELIDPGTQTLNVLLTSNGDVAGALADPVGSIHRVTYWRGGFFVPSHYHEQMPSRIISAFGPMDCSEFTGNGGMFGWGGPVHGYRATVQGKGYVISILTICPAGSWSAMQGPFMKVLQSIGPADGSSWHPDADDTNTSGSPIDSGSSNSPSDNSNSPNGAGVTTGPIAIPSNGVTTIEQPDPNAATESRGRRGYGGDSGDE